MGLLSFFLVLAVIVVRNCLVVVRQAIFNTNSYGINHANEIMEELAVFSRNE